MYFYWKIERFQKELDAIATKAAVPIRFSGGQLQNVQLNPENQEYDESVSCSY